MSEVANAVDYEKGETPMTDYQFQQYEKMRDKCEALEKELALIQGNGSTQCEQGITDYQYKHLLEFIEKVDTLTHENDALRQQLSEEIGDGMTDFQYKQILEMTYQILKANVEAGKTPEEILEIIAVLKNGMGNENK